MKGDIDEPEEFKLFEFSENDGSSNTNSAKGRDSNKSENIVQLTETYLFKYEENDYHVNILSKYYASLKEKEIIFLLTKRRTNFVIYGI